MKSEIIIRKAMKEDLPPMVELWWKLSVVSESFSNVAFLKDQTSSMKDCYENYARSFDWENYRYVVAVSKNEIIGFSIGSIQNPPQKSKFHKKANVDALYVKDEYRRKGIAAKMLKEIFNYAKEQAADYITVTTEFRNLIALQTYRKFGFKEQFIELEASLK